MDEIRRRTLTLPVVLTSEELEEKKQELVRWTQTADDNEAHLEAWVAEMKEEKKLKEATVMSARGYAIRAARTIQAGKEDREVDVADYFDTGNIVTVRLDTGEQVSTRAANEHERQMLLAVPEEKVPEDEEPVCSCESEEVASIDCPIHDPHGKGDDENAEDAEPEEPEDDQEGDDDGGSSNTVS